MPSFLKQINLNTKQLCGFTFSEVLLWNSQNSEHQKYYFMGCYCVQVWNKPMRCEITKLQTAMLISLWFEVCLRILNFIVIGQYTINIPEIFQVFTVFW